MYLDYGSKAMQKWRKEVQDYLGFELHVPEYAEVVYSSEEYMSPVWNYFYRFYNSNDKVICRLKHSNDFFFFDDETCVPGVPETFGSDEDWDQLFSSDYPPVFKGFPWSFSLKFFDEQERPVTEVVARRTLQNDSHPTIHMAWYLYHWTYDDSGEAAMTNSWKYFDWVLPQPESQL